jgi:Protein of unknown function (DUF3987)
VLAHRDELVSLLKTLDREEYAAARGFFLTAWNGTTPYKFDRIGRGKVHIEGACLSLIGSTQPGKLAEYVRRAVGGGSGDDGLIQLSDFSFGRTSRRSGRTSTATPTAGQETKRGDVLKVLKVWMRGTLEQNHLHNIYQFLS